MRGPGPVHKFGRQPLHTAAPVYQMREYYVYGTVDDCTGHWSKFYACLKRKTRFKEVSWVPRGHRPAAGGRRLRVAFRRGLLRSRCQQPPPPPPVPVSGVRPRCAAGGCRASRQQPGSSLSGTAGRRRRRPSSGRHSLAENKRAQRRRKKKKKGPVTRPSPRCLDLSVK